MEARLEALLDQLHQDGVAFDAALADRRERRRNLEPDSAQLLHLLVLATGAKRLLELGTSNGYSTIWLGAAVAANEGEMVSVDLDQGRLDEARANVAAAGLEATVELRQRRRRGDPRRRRRAPRSTSSSSTPNGPSTRPTGRTSSAPCARAACSPSTT